MAQAAARHLDGHPAADDQLADMGVPELADPDPGTGRGAVIPPSTPSVTAGKSIDSRHDQLDGDGRLTPTGPTQTTHISSSPWRLGGLPGTQQESQA
jgi:hypothetical protein